MIIDREDQLNTLKSEKSTEDLEMKTLRAAAPISPGITSKRKRRTDLDQELKEGYIANREEFMEEYKEWEPVILEALRKPDFPRAR